MANDCCKQLDLVEWVAKTRQHHQGVVRRIDHWHSIYILRGLDARKEAPMKDLKIQRLPNIT